MPAMDTSEVTPAPSSSQNALSATRKRSAKLTTTPEQDRDQERQPGQRVRRQREVEDERAERERGHAAPQEVEQGPAQVGGQPPQLEVGRTVEVDRDVTRTDAFHELVREAAAEQVTVMSRPG